MAATPEDLMDRMDSLSASINGLVGAMKAQQAATQAVQQARQAQQGNWIQRQHAANVGGGMAGRASRGLVNAGRAASKAGFGGAGMLLKGAGAAGMVVTALHSMYKALVQTTDQQIEVNRQYAAFSGSMAMVMAMRDVREMQRSREKGDALAGSAGELVGAEQKRKDATKDIEILADSVVNTILAGVNNLMAEFLTPINDFAKDVRKKLEEIGWLKASDRPTNIASDVLEIAHEAHHAAVRRNDPWFNRTPVK